MLEISTLNDYLRCKPMILMSSSYLIDKIKIHDVITAEMMKKSVLNAEKQILSREVVEKLSDRYDVF